ncbi:hypothetical protein F5X96DRAFT_616295 [Biscogniauxia mediterranea]|nr:hypothetical protein F5X96DRAFT_616295 [Biscogniauxia mediterranea]
MQSRMPCSGFVVLAARAPAVRALLRALPQGVARPGVGPRVEGDAPPALGLQDVNAPAIFISEKALALALVVESSGFFSMKARQSSVGRKGIEGGWWGRLT